MMCASKFLSPAILLWGMMGLGMGVIPSAQADTLQQQVYLEAHRVMPRRGMTMVQVAQHFGQPEARLPAAGGQKRVWPVIHRWVYPHYVVYFERNRVLHSVLKAPPGEKPVR